MIENQMFKYKKEMKNECLFDKNDVKDSSEQIN